MEMINSEKKSIKPNIFYRIPDKMIQCNHCSKGYDNFNRLVCFDCGVIINYVN